MTSIRTRGIMYVQQIIHLPIRLSSIEVRLKALNCKRWAYVIHNSDKRADGTQQPEHVHLMMEFENPRSIASIAKIIDDGEEHFESMTKHNGKNGIVNGFCYLIHDTNTSRDKHQYNPNEVKANFDYVAYLSKITISSSKQNNETQAANAILDKMGANLLTKSETQQELLNLGGHVLAKNSDKINKLFNSLMESKYKRWFQEKIDSKDPINIYWLYGEAGTGKTRFAKENFQKFSENIFVTGGSNDMFQEYEGQSFLIIDELRPDTFKYADLLRMLDPWSNNSMSTSRYHNKWLMADQIIITSPFSPIAFYNQIKHAKGDSFKQLDRRISLVLEFSLSEIHQVRYNGNFYQEVPGQLTKNTFVSEDQYRNDIKLSDILGGELK